MHLWTDHTFCSIAVTGENDVDVARFFHKQYACCLPPELFEI